VTDREKKYAQAWIRANGPNNARYAYRLAAEAAVNLSRAGQQEAARTYARLARNIRALVAE
jgi:hypothetical protein